MNELNFIGRKIRMLCLLCCVGNHFFGKIKTNAGGAGGLGKEDGVSSGTAADFEETGERAGAVSLVRGKEESDLRFEIAVRKGDIVDVWGSVGVACG